MKNKVFAALFAFFLGGLGLHKFYLGETGWGIAYLLFSWTGIPFIAAFIEGILLLTKSDAEFDYKYNGAYLIVPTYSTLEQAASLEKLAELHAKGLITDDEFESKRRLFLERM